VCHPWDPSIASLAIPKKVQEKTTLVLSGSLLVETRGGNDLPEHTACFILPKSKSLLAIKGEEDLPVSGSSTLFLKSWTGDEYVMRK
jgi:hypothetical protein